MLLTSGFIEGGRLAGAVMGRRQALVERGCWQATIFHQTEQIRYIARACEAESLPVWRPPAVILSRNPAWVRQG